MVPMQEMNISSCFCAIQNVTAMHFLCIIPHRFTSRQPSPNVDDPNSCQGDFELQGSPVHGAGTDAAVEPPTRQEKKRESIVRCSGSIRKCQVYICVVFMLIYLIVNLCNTVFSNTYCNSVLGLQ
jgi:hypothetical protein